MEVAGIAPTPSETSEASITARYKISFKLSKISIKNAKPFKIGQKLKSCNGAAKMRYFLLINVNQDLKIRSPSETRSW